MYLSGAQLTLDDVALLAEGVDRNNEVHQYQNYDNSRPPRGGRG